MERLLILDFEGHERYRSLEIQVFDDDDHGRGCCVLLDRVDEKVDVYRQPGPRQGGYEWNQQQQ